MKKHEQSSPDTAELEGLFERARGDGFTPAQTEELWSRVAVGVGTAGHASGATSPGASLPAGAGSAGVKVAAWIVGGALALSGGGLALTRLAQRTTSDAAARAVASSPPASAPVPPEPAVQLPRVAEAPPAQLALAPGAEAAPAVGEPSVRARPERATVRSTSLSSSSASSPAQVARVAPAARAQMQAARDDVAPAPAAIDAPPSAPPRHEETRAPASGPGEGALLLRARQVLASDPAAALALTQEHARSFPSGELVPEREVLAIEALARLGRTGEARARFDAFQARFPRSPHLARLQALVGG